MQTVCAMHGGRVRESLLHIFSIPGGIALVGEVDMSNEAILQSSLATACGAPEVGLFVVDLGRLTFLDAAGAGALLTGTAAHRRNGGSVLLRAARPPVDRILSLLRVDRELGCIMEGSS